MHRSDASTYVLAQKYSDTLPANPAIYDQTPLLTSKTVQTTATTLHTPCTDREDAVRASRPKKGLVPVLIFGWSAVSVLPRAHP